LSGYILLFFDLLTAIRVPTVALIVYLVVRTEMFAGLENIPLPICREVLLTDVAVVAWIEIGFYASHRKTRKRIKITRHPSPSPVS
jgi:hypothetical protein